MSKRFIQTNQLRVHNIRTIPQRGFTIWRYSFLRFMIFLTLTGMDKLHVSFPVWQEAEAILSRVYSTVVQYALKCYTLYNKLNKNVIVATLKI